MASVWRFLCLATIAVLFIGCETIPQHKAYDTYPASGPTGLRLGVNYGKNLEDRDEDEINDSDQNIYNDAQGFAAEFPYDFNPFIGLFLGVGWEQMEIKSNSKMAG